MFANRMPYVLVVLALLVVTFFAFQQAASAGAIARAGQSNAQAIQPENSILRGHRGAMNPNSLFSRQSMAAAGPSGPIADHSYDAIEDLRVRPASR